VLVRHVRGLPGLDACKFALRANLRRCGAGHEWSAAFNNVRNLDSWCPQCAGRAPLSLADAQSAAAKLGGVCLSDAYTNGKTPLLWRCGAGHEWSASFANVRHNGSWCPQCAHRGRPPLTLVDAQAAAAKLGGECLSGTFANCKTPLRWRCAAGHEWSATFNHVVHGGSWCPQCAGRAPLSLADAQSAAAKLGGVCLSDTYTNSKTPLLWRCEAGHEWSAPFRNVRTNGTWCPRCARRGQPPLALADAQSAAVELGGVCLSDTYSNCMTPLLWRCAAGHEWSSSLRNVRNCGTWCPQCARLGRAPLTLADAQAAAAMHGGACLSDTYSSNTAPLRWRCAAGHEWRAPLVKIRNCRQWCRLCAKVTHRRPRNHRRVARRA
jgi:hypothetical protein